MSKPLLVIVIPCYNEEAVLPETARRLAEKISQLVLAQIISPQSALFFVDDGSTDNTWKLIEAYHQHNAPVFGGVKLSKNSGHQAALLCGLLSVKDYADIAISIDADLQDDIEAIGKMIDCYLSGAEIVLGVHSEREADSFFKRMSANFFYRFMRLLGANLVENHADFRLMNSAAINALALRREASLFIRGIVPSLGYTTGIVQYSRKKRLAGKSKYTAIKMIRFALAGIFSAGITGKYISKLHTRKKRHADYTIEKMLCCETKTENRI